MFFDTFLIHIAKIYWSPTMCKSLCPSRCLWVLIMQLFWLQGWALRLPFTGLLPQYVAFWLSAESYCILEASARTFMSPWFWLPIRAIQFVKTTCMWKVWPGETRGGCLAAELTPENGKPFSWRTGYSLFKSDFFFFWEVKDRDVSRNFDPNYS